MFKYLPACRPEVLRTDILRWEGTPPAITKPMSPVTSHAFVRLTFPASLSSNVMTSTKAEDVKVLFGIKQKQKHISQKGKETEAQGWDS